MSASPFAIIPGVTNDPATGSGVALTGDPAVSQTYDSPNGQSVSPRGDVLRLLPDDIRFLAMEGGGGKGFAYLGAIEILERLGIMDHISGFSGASAGGITALLLSIGYRSDEIAEFLDTTDFNSFFDTPSDRMKPIVGGGVSVQESAPERALVERLESLAGGVDILPKAIEIITPLLAASSLIHPGFLVGAILTLWAGEGLAAIKRLLEDHGKEPPASLLLENWPKYLAYLGRDMGLFSGCAARSLFDRLISERLNGAEQNITFAQHFAKFKKRLVVTGANLSTSQTQIFSATETPAFPVADAVRISMGLPFVFKPYVVEKSREGWPACGTYVDGGLWNNLPFREFDVTSGGEGAGFVAKPNTLALRLEITPTVAVENFLSLIARVANYGLFGTGESQVLSRYVDQMILLDTRGLDLINFKPPRAERDRAVKRARRETLRYFGMADSADSDPEDDLETERLRAFNSACSGDV